MVDYRPKGYVVNKMSEPLVLNRLQHIGPIVAGTPMCVIMEVARSHRVAVTGMDRLNSPEDIQRVITAIKNTQIVSCNERDLSALAAFVNNATLWTRTPLQQAYTHLMATLRCPGLLPTGPWVVGGKTPENPFSFDATMLYRICQHHNISTFRATTLNQLEWAVRQLIRPEPLRETLRETLTVMPTSRLISLAMHPEMNASETPELPPPPLIPPVAPPISPMPFIRSNGMSEEISRVHRSLHDTNVLQRRAVPTTHLEAIILGVCNFDLDLCEAQSPLDEYARLSQVSLASFIPAENPWRDRYLRNPSWYRVSQNWRPVLTFRYSPEQLREFAHSEGILPIEISSLSAETTLQMSRVTPSFFPGIHPHCDETVTATSLDDIRELASQQLVTFGISEGSSFQVYRFKELAYQFLDARQFINPAVPAEVFPGTAMRKLRLIVQRILATTGSEISGIRAEAEQLQNAIREVDRQLLVDRERTAHLVELYQSSSSEVQASWRTAFHLLLETAMYMRGWKIRQQEYPLTSEETTYPADRQPEVEINVTQSLGRLCDHLGTMMSEAHANIFRELPLMKDVSSGGEIAFAISTDQAAGVTIWQRLMLVSRGDSAGTHINSCIRVSSSWLARTSYYYLTALDLPEPFPIHRLRHVT